MTKKTLSPDERDRYIIERLRSTIEPISGESLAVELGMSRVALWKRIESLKAWGYGIEASRRGYTLIKDDGLACWELDAPGPVVVFDTVASTMDEARELAIGGAPSGTTILALGQTAGRGHAGGPWDSPAGGLYLSFVVRSVLPPSHAGALSLETAAAAMIALESAGVEGVEFVWPCSIVADLETTKRKLGGILVEMYGDIAAADFFVVGLGINTAPLGLSANTADGAGRRAGLATSIVRSVVEWAAAPRCDPARWSRLSPRSGSVLSVELWNGEHRSISPIGFDERGDIVPLGGGGAALSIGECRVVHSVHWRMPGRENKGDLR